MLFCSVHDSFWKCKTIRTESASALMNQSVFLSGLFGIRLHKLKWLFPWLWIFTIQDIQTQYSLYIARTAKRIVTLKIAFLTKN